MISPVISASTLIGVAYLYIQHVVPIYVFMPVFVIFMVFVATIIGFKFRGIQLSTDEDMKYEKQKELNKTLYEIMKVLNNPKLNSSYDFTKRMETVKRIAEGNA